jgi:hypothetical protein
MLVGALGATEGAVAQVLESSFRLSNPSCNAGSAARARLTGSDGPPVTPTMQKGDELLAGQGAHGLLAVPEQPHPRWSDGGIVAVGVSSRTGVKLLFC